MSIARLIGLFSPLPYYYVMYVNLIYNVHFLYLSMGFEISSKGNKTAVIDTTPSSS